MEIAGVNIDVGTIFSGLGQLAKDIRTAITGQEPIDATKAAELALKAEELNYKVLEAENAAMSMQAQINLQDAKSEHLLQYGWRPCVGWLCNVGLLYSFLLQPLMSWASGIYKFPTPPVLDMAIVIQLLFALLGVAGLRSFDKSKAK